MSRRKLSIVLSLAVLAVAAALPAAAQGLAISSAEGWLRNSAGEPLLQAGAHPDFNTTISLTTIELENGNTVPDGNPKDIEVTLPPGLIGNPTATRKCPQGDLVVLKSMANCDPATQVGLVTIATGTGTSGLTVPVYNMVPPPGVAGDFGFNFEGNIVQIDSNVTAAGEYRLRSIITHISQGLAVRSTSLTLWGVPASPVHDLERTPKGQFGPSGNPVPGQVDDPRPLMSNPTVCGGPALVTDVSMDSWQAPGLFDSTSFDHDANGNPFTFSGCDRVPFEASLEVQPTSQRADSPSGLDVVLELPQSELPEGIGAAPLRDAVVTLPEGTAVNPASAGGLGSCSPAQIGLGSNSQPSCPEDSKVGSARIDTPLLEEPLVGSVYLAQQRQNQFGSLLALYLVVDDPTTGVLLKIPGKVETDPQSGRLVARFTDAPQLPTERLQLDFDGGPRAALVTPPACGTYTTQGEFTPWSGAAPVVSSDSFQITTGPEGQPCPSGRFDPAFDAGTADPAAGRFSPFEVRISRGDGSQRLGSVTVQLPKGLLARLAGIPYCADAALAAIPAAEGTGAAELAHPSCSAASRIGSVAVAAGAGSSPFWVKTGSAYLAGPYKGAPLSLAIVTPALAGPFDLGNVLVRVALQVDPETAQVTAVSDPLPTILQGIPLDLRDIRVLLDRPEFTLNPTNCRAQRFSATIASSAGAAANPSAPFAASSCDGLGFSPRLTLSLRGGTKRGAHPALLAQLRAKPGQANFDRVSVALPHSEFLAQEHIRTICTRVQFRAQQCPAASVYGFAEAKTPLLDQPLRGPVYLRSSNHKLPDLVAALRGQIEIDLDGRIDSHHQGIRTTFESLPDAPVSSFTLRMKGGARSLLVNSTTLCRGKHSATVRMLAQNGRQARSAPALGVRCGGPKAK